MTSQSLPIVFLPAITMPHRCGSLLAAIAASFVMLTAMPAKAPAQNTETVVARVNGLEIRESDLALAEEEVGGSLPPQTTPEQKRTYLVAYLADMILVAKEAETRKISQDIEFSKRLAFARNKVLMEMLLHTEAKSAVNESAMRKVYDEATKQMADQQEVRARHILVESEAEAKAILADLKKGGDFAEIAKTKSKDPSAVAEGGDLGYFTKEQMVPEFSEVAFKLDKGVLSEPVKSQFGWHIIKVEDKRTKPVPEYDKVKDQIQSFVMRKAQSDLVTKLRAEGKIERLDTPAEQKK
jgi:peptidyl-prolyl cis-trans isomerase C